MRQKLNSFLGIEFDTFEIPTTQSNFKWKFLPLLRPGTSHLNMNNLLFSLCLNCNIAHFKRLAPAKKRPSRKPFSALRSSGELSELRRKFLRFLTSTSINEEYGLFTILLGEVISLKHATQIPNHVKCFR